MCERCPITYSIFRAFAKARGWSAADIAPFVEADKPLETAQRILSNLAGVISSKTAFAWDACELPYPLLREVYRRGALDRSLLDVEPEGCASRYPTLTVAHLSHIDRRYRGWLAMFEAGWSFEKIASTWTTRANPISPEHVEAILNELSIEPYPGPQAQFQPDQASTITFGDFGRLAKAQGWTEDWLVSQLRAHVDDRIARELLTGEGQQRPFTQDYDPDVVCDLSETVIPYTDALTLYQDAVGKVQAQAQERTCQCGCGKKVRGRQQYATQACRQRRYIQTTSTKKRANEPATSAAQSVTKRRVRRGIASDSSSESSPDSSPRKDVFTDLPSATLLGRAGMDCKAHNERTKLKAGYRDLTRECPELFE